VLALRLAAGLAIFWFLRGLFHEGLLWLDRVIDQTEGIRARTRAAVLWGGGLLSAVVGDEERSLMLAEQCLALARALDDGSMVARSQAILALQAFFRNDPPAARSEFEESIWYARRAGDAWCLSDSLGTLASIYPLQGEFERSEEAAAEGLDIARANDDRQGMRQNLFAIALCDVRLGRLDTARKAAEEGLAICRLIGDLFFWSYFLWILSLVATQTGDLVGARAFAEESLQIAEDIGAPLLLVCALEAFAAVEHAEGNDDEAKGLLVRAAEIGARGMVPYSYIATVHRGLGELAAARGDQADAWKHLEESLSIAASVGDAWGVERSESALNAMGT
jgi:tetratricopeptide (TPR) repeat protein